MNIKSIYESTQEGRFWRQDWQKLTGSVVYTAGNWYDLSPLAGAPRGNVYPGGMLTATKLYYKSGGAMWHGANVSPLKKIITSAGVYSSSTTSGLSKFTICDYLVFYPLIDLDLSDEQVMDNTVPLPRYTDGAGVEAFLVTTSDAGVADYFITMKYTNSEGVADRETPFTLRGGLGAIVGQLTVAGVLADQTGPFIPLAAGDKGIRSVQSIQLDSGSGAGWACLVLCKPLLTIAMSTYVFPSERSMAFQVPSVPQVQDEAFLGVLMGAGAAVAAGSRILGYLDFVW